MTREQIEESLFQDLCAKSYPHSDRSVAVEHVLNHKPIAEAKHREEAKWLYDNVLLKYAGDLIQP